MTVDDNNLIHEISQIKDIKNDIIFELKKSVVAQDKIINGLLITLLSDGHCLLTGVPGLGKTLLVKSLAHTLNISFKRIQFTPDLMPADIIGSEVVEEEVTTGKRDFRFIKGPIFANIILADEINRTPPKTQAALLEAMAENQVTAAGITHNLKQPFLVLATQNPIELEGTYPLPEAQLDRFLLNLVMDYLSEDQEIAMVTETTATQKAMPAPILDGDKIVELQKLVRQVPVSEHVVSYAVRLVAATRPGMKSSSEWINKMVKWGAGSRASQALILTSKASALLDGRYTAAIEDVRSLAMEVLRHRIIPSFHAEAEGITSDDIIRDLLKKIPEST